jgi:methionine-gamma-lyase
MKDREQPGFATRILGAMHLVPAEVPSEPASIPIFQSAGFSFDSLEAFDAAVEGDATSFVYSRAGNPTVDTLERIIAELEHGEAARAFASGMAAIHAALAACLKAGDHVVAPDRLYGGTYAILTGLFRSFGVECTFAPVGNIESWKSALRPNTRVVWAETITNPTLEVTDLPRLASIAHEAGARLLVDSTLTTPYLACPLDHGADLVVHSATKYLGGHGDLLGGLVVGGELDMVPVRRTLFQTGGNMAPFVAWLLLRGLETLPLRMDRHSQSAETLVAFLSNQPGVRAVHYPTLASGPDLQLRERMLPSGCGGLLSFEVKDDETARKVINRLQRFRRAGSLGDVHSLAMMPALASHRQVDAETRESMGISRGFIRLSVGLEDPEDLMDDLRQALNLD